jgi:PAS domain S-box-containing protein
MAPLLSSRRMVALALLVVGLVLLALLGLATSHYGDELKHARERHELLARVLEAHVEQTLDATALAMAGIAALVTEGEDPAGLAVKRALRQELSHLRQLRSLSLLDAQGRVLAMAGEVAGGPVDWAALAALPTVGPPVLGPVRLGTGLPVRGAAQANPALGQTAWPFVQGLQPLQRPSLPAAAPVYLVALLNPDFFAAHQAQTLKSNQLSAGLLGLDGQCVAATESAGLLAGQFLKPLPAAVAQRLQTAHASWVGPGLHADRRAASFRALQGYPLWVIVESDHQEVVRNTLVDLSGLVLAALLSAAVLLLLTAFASRSQRANEVANQELRDAHLRLADRARELDGVFASVHELLFRTDENGIVQLINARWESSTGKPTSHAVGRPFDELFSAASREAAQALLAPTGSDAGTGVRVAGSREGQLLIEGPDGAVSQLDVTMVPLMDAGRVTGYACSAVDVTALMKVQAQLQAQLAFNASMIESNPLPMSVRDIGNRYLRVNRAWETFMGRTREQVVGALASSVYPAAQAHAHDVQDRELLARGQGEVGYAAKAHRADGSPRDVYVTKALILDSHGQPAAILTSFMDISELREAERMTRVARDTAEAASAAKTVFIANISHELRTPLQTILGFSELGARRAKADVRLAGMFTDIHRAGHRMLALVNDLLDLSKLERKGAELDVLRQDVIPIVREAIAELELLASSRAVRLTLSASDTALMAEVDALRLGQVLRNLLANAIRFSPPLESVEIECLQQGLADCSQIELRIADRGPGIPADELESIFEAFVQSSKTKDGAGGTGLGLTISRRIIRAHGGHIWAANRPGGGALFTVVLPLAV